MSFDTVAPGTPPGFHPVLVADGVRASALRTPTKIALQHGEQHVSFRELVDRIDRVATAAWVDLGLRPGDHAAVMAGNSIAFMEVTLGLASIGVATAMINARSTPQEAGFICEDAEARVLFLGAEQAQERDGSALAAVERTIVLGEAYERWRDSAHGTVARPALRETDPFSIPYTAGTTGQPKGVLLSHRSRVLTMFSMGIEYGCYGPQDRALAVAPMYHGAGFAFSLAPIFFGGACVIHDRFDPERILRDLEAERITNVFLVPTHFQAIFALGERTLSAARAPSLRTIISNAAPLAQTMKRRIVSHFGEGVLYECYGSTEAAIVCNLRPPDQLVKERCVGLPFPCTEVVLRDEQGAEVAAGEVGELYSRSPYLFSGYWHRSQETEKALDGDGWCTSGDLAVRDEDGYLYIVDRKNDKIISGGVNVFPREVEEALLDHPDVSEVAVYGVPDEYWGEAVEATIVPAPGASIDVAAILDATPTLGRWKRPRHVELAPSLPRNTAGKVLRRELRRAAVARRVDGGS